MAGLLKRYGYVGEIRVIKDPSHVMQGERPECGHRLSLFLKMDQNLIQEVAFEAKECAILQESAAILTQLLRNKTRECAKQIVEEFHYAVKHRRKTGPFKAFTSSRFFRSKLGCAELPWKYLKKLLEMEDGLRIMEQ